jgi:intracellular sulfur oxidation DsrE/DsrF family protein
MTASRVTGSSALLLGLALFLLAGCSSIQNTTHGQAPASDDGVLVHIKSGPDKPHDVLMGLRMAQMMSENHPVIVYVDVDGIALVTDGGPELNMKPFGSSRAIMADLRNRNVPIYACPGCLAAANKSAADLLPGVQVAKKQKMFDFTDGRIITFDY